MKEKKLITPEFRVTIGGYELVNGMEVECFSSRESHADWCKVELSNQLFDVVKFKDMDTATVELGYESDSDVTLSGYGGNQSDFEVILSGYGRNQSGDYWKEILIKDDLIKLERTGIKAAFLDCTPQDVLKYILQMAGVEKYVLPEWDYGKKKVLVIDAQNAVNAVKDINNAWGLEHSFFFRDGVFYWGTAPDQEDIYILEENENIIALNQYGELWEAEIVAVPWIHHSQQVEVVHRKFSGLAEITKTIIRTQEAGVKMYVYFKGVN